MASLVELKSKTFAKKKKKPLMTIDLIGLIGTSIYQIC